MGLNSWLRGLVSPDGEATYRAKQCEIRTAALRAKWGTPIAFSPDIKEGKLVLRCPRNARGERLLGPDGRRLPAVLVPR